MGSRTGAFQTVVSRDPSVFGADSLRQFDAVLLNNTVGNLFTDPQLRQNLVEFVYGGGGLLGLHGASVAFTQWPGAYEDWPEFGIMLGARGANHRDSDERVFIKIEEPDHPVSRPLGGRGFEFRDEFFRVHEPYSRQRVRVLLSIDLAKTDMQQGAARGDCDRADNDYALAWIARLRQGTCFLQHHRAQPVCVLGSTDVELLSGRRAIRLGRFAGSHDPQRPLDARHAGPGKARLAPGHHAQRVPTGHAAGND